MQSAHDSLEQIDTVQTSVMPAQSFLGDRSPYQAAVVDPQSAKFKARKQELHATVKQLKSRS